MKWLAEILPRAGLALAPEALYSDPTKLPSLLSPLNQPNQPNQPSQLYQLNQRKIHLWDMRTKILLWNTKGNKQVLEALLEEAQYDLLAIQEPWINKHTKSTYYPRSSKYYLVHSCEGRAAIFVSRRFEIGHWEYEATKDYCRVWFPGVGSSGLELWSIYNPPENKTLPRDLLNRQAPAYATVLAGDFNLHHPLWDQFGRYERKAEALLSLATQWDLDLRTPAGTITRAPQGGQRGRTSTIDHFWVTTDLRTTYHGLEKRGKSDHYPQVLEVYTNGPPL